MDVETETSRDWAKDVDTETPSRLSLISGHIYIEKGQINCFHFSFLGWGQKVTYNSDIFEKLGPPPMGFQVSEF